VAPCPCANTGNCEESYRTCALSEGCIKILQCKKGCNVSDRNCVQVCVDEQSAEAGYEYADWNACVMAQCMGSCKFTDCGDCTCLGP
jgi:hypothetical protein